MGFQKKNKSKLDKLQLKQPMLLDKHRMHILNTELMPVTQLLSMELMPVTQLPIMDQMLQTTQTMLQEDLLITKILKQLLISTTLLSSGLLLLKFHSVLELCGGPEERCSDLKEQLLDNRLATTISCSISMRSIKTTC
jgi:hypothetical protein